MAKRFVRHFGLALGIFIVMAVLVYTNVEIAHPVTEYVAFVVTTDFPFQPIFEQTTLFQRLANWNLDSWFDRSAVGSGW